MIQRKQSLYLLIGILSCIGFLVGNPKYATLTGNLKEDNSFALANAELKYTYSEVYDTSMTNKDSKVKVSNQYIHLTLWALVLLSLVSIFLFKNRALQLRLTAYLLIFDLLLFFLLYYQTNYVGSLFSNFETQWNYNAFLGILLPIVHILAIRGIVHDIKLLKAVDRLR